MRSRGIFFTALLVAGVFVLPHFAEASIPFFGPIIPDEDKMNLVCPAGWGMLMIVVNRIIEFAITLAIVFVAPIMIAYAGFLYVINPVSPEGRSRANEVLRETIVGIVIALSAWMIVDAIMVAIYDGSAGTWSELISSGGEALCLPQKGALPGDELSQAIIKNIGVVPTGGKFTFDSGIDAQIPTQSGALSSLLSCMAGKVAPGVGRISSISDSVIVNGNYSFKQCADSRVCSHTANSCHYGGKGSCNGSSYAVDFGDEQNRTALTSAAQACGGVVLNEGNHLHVSVGASNGCGCDTNL